MERRSFMKCGQKQRRFMKCCQKKVTFIQKTATSATVQKNNKQRIVEVKRDILSWLVTLLASSALVVNYEKAMSIIASAFNHCNNSTKQPKVGNISRSKQITDH